ncbi:LOW QUALITY PROTEIN: Hsp70-like protein, partial [Phytophthora palmivora]
MSTSARRPKGAAALGGVNVGSLLLLLGGVFAVFAALLARHGFTGRDHVVGIDLGTTYSVVAISQKNNVTAITDQDGHVLVPSTVAFLPDGGLCHCPRSCKFTYATDITVSRSASREARAHRTTDPQHTIFNAKRFIGQRYVGNIREPKQKADSFHCSYDDVLSSETEANGGT